MRTLPSRTPTRADRALIGRLVVACTDAARAQSAAARIVGGEQRTKLLASAAQRRSFALELGETVRMLGGRAEQVGSLVETIRALIQRANAFVVGESVADAYDSCARVEAKTEKLYERGLRANMPENLNTLLARQYLEVTVARGELRRLSMGG